MVSGLYPGVEYTITAFSGDGYGQDYDRKPQLLAISDISNEFSLDGFEDGNYAEFTFLGTSNWVDLSLVTDVVAAGSFSVKGDTTGAGSGTNHYFGFTPNTFAAGYYYLQLQY